MSTILFAWEFGTGLGHITRIQPLAAGLIALGHKVIVAAREVAPCYELLQPFGVPVYQAPIEAEPRARTPTAETYAHVLFNCGFAEARDVEARVAAWRLLFDSLHPDLIVADCAPTALLAAHCASIPRIALGTGFECPPNVSPLPPLRRQTQSLAPPSDTIEQSVLANINAVCNHFSADPLQRVAHLYYGMHEPLLLTFHELDCYAPRETAHYWGPIIYSNGQPPVWPNGNGPRVFAYLLEHEFTPAVVGLLAKLGWPSLIVGGHESIAKSSVALPDSIRICHQQFDSQLIAAQCDFTICYAGHGTICVTLLAGKPLLLLATTVEQYLNSLAVTTIGAGELGQVGNAVQVRGALERIATNYMFVHAARNFSARNLISGAQPTANQVVANLQALLAS
jgi:UDP:flavonoid glycosyltransferase YjiC (YdhE family)